MSSYLERLFVIWGEAETGARHVVGELWRDDEGFGFAYASDAADLEERGFVRLPEFPRLAETYRSRYLFATFAQRIPSPKRPDYQRLLELWGIERADDVFEILARSGGVQATDRLELAEYRSTHDELRRPLEFRVAGTGHATGADHARPGDPLVLRVEPDNASDPHATLVLLCDGTKVGYVPKQYSAMFSTLLQRGTKIEVVVVRRVRNLANRERLVVCARG